MRNRVAIWVVGLACLLLCTPGSAAVSWPRAAGTDFRVLVWNVSREQFFAQGSGFKSALRAADADLLILDEMSPTFTAADVAQFLNASSADPAHPWQVAYGSSGYNQRVVFALRGAIKPLAAFKLLTYPPRFVAWLRAQASNPQNWRDLHTNLAAGIGVFGAEAQMSGRRLMLVGVDLQCCGDRDDAWEERRRWVEVRAIRGVLDKQWSQRRPDAVLVAGDFNAVRGRKVVELMRGSARAGAARLSVVDARHANGVDVWTWDGRGSAFPSRQIDFMLYSRNLKLLKSIVFDPETMTASERERLGLTRDQFIALSEHRPVVADFRWR